MGTTLVSYSSKDRAFVSKLATDFKNAGHDIWLDIWNITGQTSFFWDEIQAAIDSCSHFVFVISPDSLDPYSDSLKELYYALSLKPTPVIILVICEACPINYSTLPMVISPNRYQIHDFTKTPYDIMLQQVLIALEPALSTPNNIVNIRKSIFTELDFEGLGDLIKRSGRANGAPARTALCNSIGIDPGEVDVNGNDIDFSINFVAFIYRTGNFSALGRICDLLQPLLHGSLKMQLEMLCVKIRNLT
jgi:hypothetical protein